MARSSGHLRRAHALRSAGALLGATTLVTGLVVLSPFGTGVAAASTSLINDSFATSTSSSTVDVASIGTGSSGQPLPCLTAAGIAQSSPTSNSTTPGGSATFTDQISTTGTRVR